MILVSQDRSEILNFDRLTEIVVSDKNICVSDSIKQQQGFIIATYKTEERAKEVIYDITKAYCIYNGKPHTWGDIQELLGKYEYGVYEMPKE